MEDASTGERKDRNPKTSTKTNSNQTPSTPPQAKVTIEVVDEVEESSPKRLNYEEGGNSADEDMEAEADEETNTNDVVALDPEEIAAITLERIKGKLLVLDDYLSIF